MNKRILSLVLVLAMCVCWFSFPAAAVSASECTVNPEFGIGTWTGSGTVALGGASVSVSLTLTGFNPDSQCPVNAGYTGCWNYYGTLVIDPGSYGALFNTGAFSMEPIGRIWADPITGKVIYYTMEQSEGAKEYFEQYATLDMAFICSSHCLSVGISVTAVPLLPKQTISCYQASPASCHYASYFEGARQATCLGNGSTGIEKCVCQSCNGKVIKAAEPLPATGHSDVTHHEYKDSSCSEAGNIEYWQCGSCGICYTDEDLTDEVSLSGTVIAKKPHTEETVPGYPATCTEDGLGDGKRCSVCGAVILEQKVLTSPGHNEVTVPGRPATCTEPGLTEGKHCTVCGKDTLEQTEIPAPGHDDEVIPGREPTCTEPGYTDGKICTVCGDVTEEQTEIPAKGHSCEHHDAVEPSSDSDGSLEYWYCTVCKEYFLDEECTQQVPYDDTIVIADGNEIIYVLNGGVNDARNTHHYYSDTGKELFDASREGYVFAGWYRDEAQNYPITGIPAGMEGSVTVYAKWAPAKYSVHFDPAGGTGIMKDIPATYDKAVALTANAFKRAGFTFGGWDLDGDGAADYANKAVAGNLGNEDGAVIVLSAVWNPVRFSVIYNGNKGKDETGKTSFAETGIVYASGNAAAGNDFFRKGYVFSGWNTKADGKGKTYMPGDDISTLTATASGKVNLYAAWRPVSYAVVLDGNGAEYTQDAIAAVYDKTFKLPSVNPVRAGYTFLGWSADKDAVKASYKAKASVKNLCQEDGGNTVLYAVWQANTYSIVYNVNGGKIAAADKAALAKQTVVTDVSSATVPDAKPEFAKYTFAGWDTKKDGTGTRYHAGMVISKEDYPAKNKGTLTLYAVWEYTLTLVDPNSKATQKVTLKYNVNGAPDPGFTNRGYYIAGWATTEGAVLTGTIKYKDGAIKNAVAYDTLYAIWKGKTYTVNFKANGGTGKMKPQKLTWGKSTALSANTFKNPGMTFEGWSFLPNGGALFANKEKVEKVGSWYEESVTLYAIWKNK